MNAAELPYPDARSPHAERFHTGALARNTAIAAIVAVPIVPVIRAITVSLTSVHGFQPLTPGPEIAFTLLGLLAAAATAVLLNRYAQSPMRSFRRVVPIALAVSFIPDLALWAAGGQARAATILPLMIMHTSVATLAYIALSRSSERPPQAGARS